MIVNISVLSHIVLSSSKGGDWLSH